MYHRCTSYILNTLETITFNEIDIEDGSTLL